MINLRFCIYSFVVCSLLFAVGYTLSIDQVSITTLPTSLMCEKDPFIEQYLCYQP